VVDIDYSSPLDTFDVKFVDFYCDFLPAKLHQMKKALDYVSDYQLESACKDAPCIALSKVSGKIFAVLVD